MKTYLLSTPKCQARHIKIAGRVQGVGFRPFVKSLADRLNLSGWVRNTAGEVEIWAQGNIDSLNEFEQQLINKPPPLAIPLQYYPVYLVILIRDIYHPIILFVTIVWQKCVIKISVVITIHL